MKTGVFSKGERAMEAEANAEELFREQLYGEFEDLTDEEILLAIKEKTTRSHWII